MQRVEYPAGPTQKVIAYTTDDTGAPVDVHLLLAEFAAEADRLERDGWRVIATTMLPMRQMGTAGNILFQSGGQYVTRAALMAVFAQVDR